MLQVGATGIRQEDKRRRSLILTNISTDIIIL
jgi:hypothetical protein